MIILKTFISYLKKIGIFLSIIIIFCIITSLLNLIGISKNITSIITLIFQVSLFFMYGFIHGKKTDKKGFIEGLKVGILLIIIIFLLSLILFDYDFKVSNLIYYLILGLVSIFGAIFGKNKK